MESVFVHRLVAFACLPQWLCCSIFFFFHCGSLDMRSPTIFFSFYQSSLSLKNFKRNSHPKINMNALDVGISCMRRHEKKQTNPFDGLSSLPVDLCTIILSYCMCDGLCCRSDIPLTPMNLLCIELRTKLHLWVPLDFYIPDTLVCRSNTEYLCSPFKPLFLERSSYKTEIRLKCSCQRTVKFLQKEANMWFMRWDYLLKQINVQLAVFKIRKVSLEFRLGPSQTSFEQPFLSHMFSTFEELRHEMEAWPFRQFG